MIALARRLVDVVARPRATLLSLARTGHGDATDVVLLFVVVRLVIQAPFIARALWLAGEAPGPALRRIGDALFASLRTDITVLLVAGVVVFALAKILTPPGREAPLGLRHAFAVTAYAGVPLAVLQLAGALTALLGFDAWWLPHHSLGSPSALIVDGRLSIARVVAKAAIAYAVPLVVIVDFIVAWRRGSTSSSADDAARPRRRGVAVLLGGLALATLALTGRYIVENRASLRPLLPGDPLPAFALPRLLLPDGKLSQKRMTLDEHKGKVVVLDFWASWCAPCRRAMPELEKLHAELGPQGLVVVGVNREPEAPSEAARALRELGVTFPSVLDGRVAGGRVYGDVLGVSSLPTTFVVDRRGILRHLHVGYAESHVLRDQIVALLAEAP